MRFGPTPLPDAVGGILAHSVRLPDGAVLRKGRVLRAGDVDVLRAAGLSEVTVALLDDDDVGEDEAAQAMATALAGPGLSIGRPATGRCNLLAAAHGPLAISTATVRTVNEVDEAVTVSTLPPDAVVHPGTLAATVKVIPFAVPRALVEEARAAAGGSGRAPLSVLPFLSRSAALVQTAAWEPDGERALRAEQVLRRRLEACGSTLDASLHCRHEVPEVRRAIEEAVAPGREVVLLLGASAVGDRRDVLPAAVRAAGGEIVRFGLPVDPGNLVLVGRLGHAVVLGVPGCARSPARSGFDWVLEQILAGRDPEALDYGGAGVGGLLKETRARGALRRAPSSAEPPAARVAAVVLAAGRSTRMGGANKLLARVEGRPIVRRVVDALAASSVERVVVVVGHQAEAVRAALAGADVEVVENPSYALGIATSVGAGIEAVAGSADAALVALGDMPWVRAADVDALVAAFNPEAGRGICAPVADRKRGNPVLWAARYFDELRGLEGDVGARDLLVTHADDVHEVRVAGAGVLLDVDTPEALERTGGSHPA